MKKVFLTGASSGIGKAIAESLVRRGDEVWGTARDLDRLPRRERFHRIALDLASPASVRDGWKTALSEAGRFEVVINNAGSGHFGRAERLPNGLIEEQFRVLVFAQIEICQLACAAMIPQGGGMIIQVTSLAARLPVPFMAAYNSAKSAMASYIFTLQIEQRARGIKMVDLQPADICTDFNEALRRSGRANNDDPEVARAWATVDRNLRKAPKPQLVAETICRLLEMENPPPRVTVGDRFQSLMAPLIFRFLPQRLRVWGLQRYYQL